MYGCVFAIRIILNVVDGMEGLNDLRLCETVQSEIIIY